MLEHEDVQMIKKDELNTWLEKLQKDEHFNIFGPVAREDYSEFSLIENPSDIDLTLRNTVISPKGIMFPQSMTMLEFDLKDKIPTLKVPVENNKRLIIGIRPCDVHGILAFDPTFDSEFSDPFYKTARANTFLVGLACNEPDLNCFCQSMSSGPFDGTGMDILMVELESTFIFYIYTASGEKLLKVASELFTEPTPEQLTQVDELKKRTHQASTRKVETNNVPEKMGKIFEDDYWLKIAQRCLGCGICTYLCPTCYCFDITDEKWGITGKRMRNWDSCMYSEYTVHASGYNPRPARMNRLRNRFYHKFKYYPDLYNMFGCTGCGRCVRHCPVNIDIIDVINGVKGVEVKTGGGE